MTVTALSGEEILDAQFRSIRRLEHRAGGHLFKTLLSQGVRHPHHWNRARVAGKLASLADEVARERPDLWRSIRFALT